MTLKHLLLSGVALTTLLSHSAQATTLSETESPVKVEIIGQNANISYLKTLPKNSRLEYVLRPQDTDTQEISVHNSDKQAIQIELPAYFQTNSYILETYLIENEQKTLITTSNLNANQEQVIRQTSEENPSPENKPTTSITNEASPITLDSTSDPTVVVTNSSPNTITVTINGIQGTPTEVLVPTWTEHNGQDDLIWHNAYRQTDGSYQLQLSTSEHNNEGGIYHFHVYQRSQAGQEAIWVGGTQTTIETPIPSTKQPTFSITNLQSSQGTYSLNINPEKTVLSIDIAVWSLGNQDDLKWYHLSSNTQNSYSLNVDIKQHQSLSKIYSNHVYINYSDGSRIGYIADPVDFSSFKPTPHATANYLRNGFYDLTLSNVEEGTYQFAVWSDTNGQDDLVWYTATSQGNGTYKHLLDLSQHKNSGTYHLHIYRLIGKTQLPVLGTSFLIPNNHLPIKPTVITPTIPKNYTPTYYPVGQCTWGVKQVAPWVGEWWGNAKDWANTARSLGYTIGNTPKIGAIAVWPTDGGGYGHVAVVTHVDNNSRIQVLEANYNGNQYISNFRGWFNPNQIWGGSRYVNAPVSYIYPK